TDGSTHRGFRDVRFQRGRIVVAGIFIIVIRGNGTVGGRLDRGYEVGGVVEADGSDGPPFRGGMPGARRRRGGEAGLNGSKHERLLLYEVPSLSIPVRQYIRSVAPRCCLD